MYNLKPKKCAVCKEAYQPHQTLQRVCSQKCGLAFAVEKREKKERATTREMKRVLRETDRAYWIKKAHDLCRVWWERHGRKMTTGEADGNATVWIFNMKNRFGWNDKHLS